MSEINHEIQWRISTQSFQGNCVEIGAGRGGVRVRHSRDRDGAVLLFTADEWRAFLAGAKAGEFDLDDSSFFADKRT